MRRRRLPLPPSSLRFMGDTDEGFLAFGEEVVAQLQEYAGLTPASYVVDVGCGYGRLAHGLLRWDGFKGRYLGMDILKPHVEWCQKNLRPHARRRFSFQHLDIRNDRYNPAGTLQPTTVALPTADSTADIAVLLSVFTHMYPDEVIHYLSELRRIIAPNGRVNATMFLLNEDWAELDREDRCRYKLAHQLNEFTRFMDPENPLHAVGYEETWVREQVAKSDLAIDGPILFGSWAGRTGVPTFQDTVILRRA
ncbi:MAG: class I SAM-dependent methyltransferase [Actinomycetota bacterium]